MVKFYAILFTIAFFPLLAIAQFYPTITFETSSTTPSNKAYNSNDTVTAGGKKWTMLGARLGAADNGDFKFDDRSVRLGKENENTGYNGCLTMQEDYPFGIHDIYFWGAMYGTHTNGAVDVFTSTNGGVSWTNEATFQLPVNSQPELFNVHKHYYGNVRIKICKSDAGSGIINLDSIYIEQMAVPPATLDLQYKYPTGANINPNYVDSLMLTYNQHIEIGTSGNITLIEENGPTTTFAFNDPNINVYDEYIIVNNINLQPSKTYKVLVDAGFVNSEYANLPNNAIVMNEWQFSTNIGAYDSFHIATNAPCGTNDTFDNVLVRRDLNVNADKWQCINENGKTFYSMKANITSGSNYAENEDWLVTVFPINIQDSMILSFEETRIGSGSNTTRGVYYTTDYKGSVNTVSWTPLLTLPALTENVTTKRTVDLSNLPDLAYIGFKYTNQQSNTNPPYEWRINNIQLYKDINIAINEINKETFSVKVLDISTTSLIQLAIHAQSTNSAKIVLYDITGKLIHEQKVDLNQGDQIIKLENKVYSAGMYLIKVYNETFDHTVKVPVVN